ncbi:pyridoxal 5'-phosphate synthase glutaminase subunit PdxT [Dehalococcoidia bacterium]|nr:pyridoxal 5'-phosphate synthase glutaminase subunit PdxT [Dehalococcoidia bacterium]
MVIGILAIQGDFLEHRKMLETLGASVTEVRLPHELDEIDGLIIPGGESTTIVQLIDIYKMRCKLRQRVLNEGMPTWGTCAGMIIISNRLRDRRPEPLRLMDIEVSRNAFGRQVNSFESDVTVKGLEGPPFRGVFIRAPVVNSVGEEVMVLATLKNGQAVAVAQRNMLATAFHPELTDDTRLHELFLKMVDGSG